MGSKYKYKYIVALYAQFVPDLKNKLLAFIERETLEDYDREAEAALQRIANGDVDINKLSNLWAKAYTEVRSTLKWSPLII